MPPPYTVSRRGGVSIQGITWLNEVKKSPPSVLLADVMEFQFKVSSGSINVEIVLPPLHC